MAIVGSSLNVPGYGWILQLFASSGLLGLFECRIAWLLSTLSVLVREPWPSFALCAVSIGFVALLSATAAHIYTQTHGNILDTIGVVM